MPTMPERVATLEARWASLVSTVDGMSGKVDALHAHFLESKGAKDLRHGTLTLLVTSLGAIAAIAGALRAFLH